MAVNSSAPSSTLALLWSVVPASSLNLSDPTRVGTSLRGGILGLLPGALAPGMTYTFRLRASDAFGNASSSVRVTTMSVPTGGVAVASPINGTELQTPFTFTTFNWTDVNLPLLYSFSFIGLGASVDGVAVSTLLADYSNSTSISGVLLPAGTNVLQVSARNSLGGVSVSLATVRVVVATQVFASPAAQASFIETLIANSSYTVSGAYSETSAVTTLALVSSIAGMLNQLSSPLSSNATAAADIRANLLTVISSASTNVSTPEALASAAGAVNALVSNLLQISASGAATALSVLQFISTGGPSLNVTINQAAVVSVAQALSSIASAALTPNGVVSSAVLQNVSDITSSLASSLLAALTTPGAAPVTVFSPLIQISVALDTSGPGSRLFSESLSAPGSASSFAPMPADIFGDMDIQTPVSTLFFSLAFDPHTQDFGEVPEPGTTTLAFSTAAGEKNISGLGTPIRFTLPLVPLADGLKAQCQFWNKTTSSYSTSGCVSLPNPLPRGHKATWKSDFYATSDAAMADAWSISGPLVSRCSFEVLDCTLNTTRAVYPNPARPFDFPAVRCNASISTEPLLAISGSACALIQADNAFGCFWNNSKHAFEGAGCVASGEPVQCACRHRAFQNLMQADISLTDSCTLFWCSD